MISCSVELPFDKFTYINPALLWPVPDILRDFVPQGIFSGYAIHLMSLW